VYGDATPEVRTVCGERRLSLCVFPWQPQMHRAGLRRNAVYLVRPDGYVGLADSDRGASAISSYLDARRLASSSH
jgi:hypothetical protein